MGIQKSLIKKDAKVLLIDNLYQDPVTIQSAGELIKQCDGAELVAYLAPFEVDNEDVKQVKSLIPCQFVSGIKIN